MMMGKSEQSEVLNDQAALTEAIDAWLCELREAIDHTGC